MAAEDDVASGADGDAPKQNWGADEDDDALPPLSNMGWADDDDDELPPLDPAWANLPVPTSPVREKPAAAFRSRDAGGGGDAGRGSVFSRLGDGGGNAWRRPDAPPDRAPPRDDRSIDRQPPRDDHNANNINGIRREKENPHDWHREQMRMQAEERTARGEPPRRNPVRETRNQGPVIDKSSVVYLERDAQRAAAAKREEDAAWRLARTPLQTFHSTKEENKPYAPSACRELLNVLSEPPFAEGRLAPNARAAFVTVAGPSKSGTPRTDEDIQGVITGVTSPLHHLLSYGVSTPGGAAAGSTGAFIAEQMHTAATKLLASALEVLAAGDVTKTAVEQAKGISLVRELLHTKLNGKKDDGAGGKTQGGGRGNAVGGRGGPAPGRGGRGEPLRDSRPSSIAQTPSPGGIDRNRWEKKPNTSPVSMSNDDRRRSMDHDPRRRSMDGEKPKPCVGDGRVAEISGARPRVVPKVVIRPKEGLSSPPVPVPAKKQPSTERKSDGKKGKGDVASPQGGVFSRLEGSPSLLPALSPPAGPKPPPGKPPAKNRVSLDSKQAPVQTQTPPRPHTLVPSPIPHPKSVVPKGKDEKPVDKKPAPKKTNPKEGKPSGKGKAAAHDEWHALDEELEKVSISKKGGKSKGEKPKSDKVVSELPHPKTVTVASENKPADKPSPVPAPKPSPTPAPKPAPKVDDKPVADELDAVLDEELAKAKKSRRSGGRGRGAK